MATAGRSNSSGDMIGERAPDGGTRGIGGVCVVGVCDGDVRTSSRLADRDGENFGGVGVVG
jgi:hypothetical protein